MSEDIQAQSRRLGAAGVLARTFIRSKLTALIAVGAVLLGLLGVLKLPREEEPQINVPMFDIFVGFPGASAKEVEERIVNLGERRLWEIPGVEYIYSTAESGSALFIVRFKVGTNPEEAMTRIYTKTFAHLDFMPPGASQPLIKPRSIDDVPILALTLSGSGLDSLALRRAAALLRQEISAVPDVSQTDIIGGHKRQFLVHFNPAALASRRLTPLEVAGIIQASNQKLPAGHYSRGGRDVAVETDAFIRSAQDLKRVVVGVSSGRPVVLEDVARVSDGPDEDEREVFTVVAGQGEAAERPAVTIAVSKRRGANATTVSEAALARVAEVQKALLPPGLQIAVTRDYGDTAKEKSDELLFHMFLATVSVTLLIALALGWREAVVVAIAIPVTLALTLLIYYLAGYTLNRITLFALIFSIGILVDDAIVVVENIHRHFSMRDGRSLWRLSVDAVAEVGNPTLLATWTVIAAILPMAFVSGLMGPYMRPIPVGASAAMLFSVAIAFIISPWAFAHILEKFPPQAHGGAAESALDLFYRRFMTALLENSRLRLWYFAAMIALLAGSLSLVLVKAVTVKMLPFDNKNEFQIVLNMPEGTALEATRRAAGEMAGYLRSISEVRRVTTYAGTSSPYNFNGLVRHYFLRQRPNQADILVSLSRRQERRRQSHDIAKEARGPILDIARRYGARVQVAEIPPGPPVLSTLVFELYGPDAAKRAALARKLRELLQRTPGIVDVDTYVPDPQPMRRLVVDRQKATLNAIPASAVAQTVSMALEGRSVDLAHVEEEREPVDIRLRLPAERRGDLSATQSIALLSRNGTPIPVGSLAQVESAEVDAPIYHKNLQPAAYVIADVSGKQESPVYAILKLRRPIRDLADSMGIELNEYFTRQPESSQEWALKWDGEWHITYEVFRDLGLAFAVVLILIYILVVGWFKSFSVPLVIMVPIPLTLVGILPAHWALGAFFTATSMIGFIAGAGIVVRNSIILVDFIQLRLKEGMPLEAAVVDAGAVRFRPMLLTAAAVVVGAGVILFDPIFQGLAVSLMAGEVASTVLSRTAVPVLYFLLARRAHLDEAERREEI
ncbi:MAG TPA: multidrug transporter AcrB [Elusimicrobia bacterium]|nr:multidrug transporter AcrB [Elusimicrobiota bacterium]HBT62779.1 multidrug transporter AcrB [Elusimicrobiota bacterium]